MRSAGEKDGGGSLEVVCELLDARLVRHRGAETDQTASGSVWSSPAWSVNEVDALGLGVVRLKVA